MIETRLFCSLNGQNHNVREQERLLELVDSGLQKADSIPVFEEATQTAAQFLQMPICWIGLMERDSLWLKTTLGLSKLGLRNVLATSRRLERQDTFCIHVVDSHQVLAIPNTLEHPAFDRNLLTQQYGLRSYLGAPLLTANGYCLGTLAVLDVEPRDFIERDIQMLHMLARWCISEFERDRLLGCWDKCEQGTASVTLPTSSVQAMSFASQEPIETSQPTVPDSSPWPVRLQLVCQLMEKITSPLTAILGMAGMLNREIYGPLTEKQREYLRVILNSGQTLRALSQEVLELASVDHESAKLQLMPVDVEMLCQQVIQSLTDLGNEYQLDLQLSVEPGQRLWHLDRLKVRQMLYHLVYGVIQSAKADGVLRLHVSRKRDHLRFVLWLSNPWLDDGLLAMESIQPALIGETYGDSGEGWLSDDALALKTTNGLNSVSVLPNREVEIAELNFGTLSDRPEHLRFLLSQNLAELHGGSLAIQNSLESGFRYILSLPLQGLETAVP